MGKSASPGRGLESADPGQQEGGSGGSHRASLEAVAQRAQRGVYCSLAAFQGAYRAAAQQLLLQVAHSAQDSQPSSRSVRLSIQSWDEVSAPGSEHGLVEAWTPCDRTMVKQGVANRHLP